MEEAELKAVKFWRKRKHFDKISWKRKRNRKRPILSGAGSGSKKYSTASTSLWERALSAFLKDTAMRYCIGSRTQVSQPFDYQPIALPTGRTLRTILCLINWKYSLKYSNLLLVIITLFLSYQDWLNFIKTTTIAKILWFGKLH